MAVVGRGEHQIISYAHFFIRPMKTIRIAITDDHQVIRAGIISLLMHFPQYEVVVEAQHGQELLDQLSVIQELPDICMVDISMPVMDGYETIKAVKALYPKMKFLAVSVFDHEYSVLRMIRNGANGYLLKSSSAEQICTALYEIYHKGYHYSEIASEETFYAARNDIKRFLNDKEIEFAALCCSEMTYKEIADKMHVSEHTVYDYHKSIAIKTGIKNRAAIVLFTASTGLLPIDV